jgi:hypothetical protein
MCKQSEIFESQLNCGVRRGRPLGGGEQLRQRDRVDLFSFLFLQYGAVRRSTNCGPALGEAFAFAAESGAGFIRTVLWCSRATSQGRSPKGLACRGQGWPSPPPPAVAEKAQFAQFRAGAVQERPKWRYRLQPINQQKNPR